MAIVINSAIVINIMLIVNYAPFGLQEHQSNLGNTSSTTVPVTANMTHV